MALHSYTAEQIESWIALAEMYSNDKALLRGAAGEVAMDVADLVKILNAFKERLLGPSQPVTADQLGKWLAFWTHYSSLNEGAQDAENDQRHLTLDDMSEAWLRLTDGTDATGSETTKE